MKVKNPVTQTQTEFVFDDDKGIVEGFKETQELPDQALEQARDISAAGVGGRPNTQKHWRHIGRIPSTIYARLREQGIAGDKVKMMRWLENNKRFLVTPKDTL